MTYCVLKWLPLRGWSCVIYSLSIYIHEFVRKKAVASIKALIQSKSRWWSWCPQTRTQIMPYPRSLWQTCPQNVHFPDVLMIWVSTVWRTTNQVLCRHGHTINLAVMTLVLFVNQRFSTRLSLARQTDARQHRTNFSMQIEDSAFIIVGNLIWQPDNRCREQECAHKATDSTRTRRRNCQHWDSTMLAHENVSLLRVNLPYFWWFISGMALACRHNLPSIFYCVSM